MLDDDQITEVAGHEVYGPGGEKIGKAGRVFVDDLTGRPKWVSVEAGLLGTHDTFVPVDEATFDGERLTVPYAKDEVKQAPALGGVDHLSPEDEATLESYYRGGTSDGLDEPAASVGDEDSGHGYSGHGDLGDGDSEQGSAMTVSEEQLAVSTRSVATERARLRKRVVTEEVTLTVTLRKEELVIEREPVADHEAGEHVGSTDFADSDQEIVLYEEVPVVEKVLRPVERVRLGTRVATEQRTVSGEVRKERVDVDQPDDPGDTDDRTVSVR